MNCAQLLPAAWILSKRSQIRPHFYKTGNQANQVSTARSQDSGGPQRAGGTEGEHARRAPAAGDDLSLHLGAQFMQVHQAAHL